MKKLLTSFAAFTALTAAASAADLPRRAAPPVFVPVPVFTWTGFYAGFNAGYGFDASSNNQPTVIGVNGASTLNSLTVSGASNLGSLAVGGTSTLTGKVTTAAVTTPAHNGANLLAAGYGNVFGAGTYTNDSGNVSVSRTGPGEYLITFSGPLATADFGSTAVALTLFNGPGFVSYTSGGSAGVLRVRTHNTAGTLTDRGFSFVVFQP